MWPLSRNLKVNQSQKADIRGTAEVEYMYTKKDGGLQSHTINKSSSGLFALDT